MTPAEKVRYHRYRNKPGVKEYFAQKQRERRAADPEKFRERNRKAERLRKFKRYGITLQDYNDLLIKQDNRCEICKQENTNKRDFHVDHCHTSGIVRGLLCQSCNLLLGHAKDNINILKNAIEYLGKTQ